MGSVDPSSASDVSSHTDLPVFNYARALLWLKQHGPLAALALFVLVDGGGVDPITGAIC